MEATLKDLIQRQRLLGGLSQNSLKSIVTRLLNMNQRDGEIASCESDIETCVQIILEDEKKWKAEGLYRRNPPQNKRKGGSQFQRRADLFILEPVRPLSAALRSAMKRKQQLCPLASGTIEELGEYFLLPRKLSFIVNRQCCLVIYCSERYWQGHRCRLQSYPPSEFNNCYRRVCWVQWYHRITELRWKTKSSSKRPGVYDSE